MNSGNQLDIAIVGCGAAGMMAGIFAGREAKKRLRIAALDGASAVGAKILVAGGGRCNVTHDVIHPVDYAPANRHRVNKVLRSFSVEQTIAFFNSLGVQLKVEDTGKLFPTTNQARTVLDALLKALTADGVQLLQGRRVSAIRHQSAESDTPGRFVLETSQGPYTARQLILCTGGKALPRTGSDGLGYTFASELGHHVTATTPALVPLTLPAGHWLTGLSGIAFETTLSLWSSTRKRLHQQNGAMLLTHKGVSGPCAMDMSRHWLAARRTDPGVTLSAALLPGKDFQAIDQLLVGQLEARPTASMLMILRTWLVERLAQGVLAQAEIAPAVQARNLSRQARRTLAGLLEALPVPVTGDRGYTCAEVTAGGVPLEEVELATMASRKCPGLYLAGEILDVDGRIGGYNFQWAWCTGRLAGLAAARALE
jgi:predicted Rossmann fold flavoprotein